MDPDEDDEEPQNEPGTSSKSQPTVPVLPLHQRPEASSQGPAASSQGPAASAKSEDEDSEYCDELLYPDLYILRMVSIGQ